MPDVFQSRFHSALTDLISERGIETDAVRETAVTTLTELAVESARLGEQRHGDQRGEGQRLPDHFEELMTAHLPRVGLRLRADVARRLSSCGHLPERVAAILADDVPVVAVPMLRHSEAMGLVDLIRIAEEEEAEKARAIAERKVLDPRLVATLVARRDPVIADSLLRNHADWLDEPLCEQLAGVTGLGCSSAHRLIDRASLSDAALARLFWIVDADTRIRILDRMDLRHPARSDAETQDSGQAPDSGRSQAPHGAPEGAPDGSGDALFGLAARGERAALAHRIAAHTDLPPALGERIVADRTGEALAVALNAAGIGAKTATGILLLTVPEAGRSYPALRRLAGLTETQTPAMARFIVDLWRAGEGKTRPAARHEPAVAQPAVTRPGDARRPEAAGSRRVESLRDRITRRTGSTEG